jgi:hypothetical protein
LPTSLLPAIPKTSNVSVHKSKEPYTNNFLLWDLFTQFSKLSDLYSN